MCSAGKPGAGRRSAKAPPGRGSIRPCPAAEALEPACLHIHSKSGVGRLLFLLPLDNVDPAEPRFLALRVQRPGSFCQKRATLLLACQSALAASTAPRSSSGTANRKLMMLLILPEKLGRGVEGLTIGSRTLLEY